MVKVQDLGIFLRRMVKTLKVKDINKNDYIINDVRKFLRHIDKYHSNGSSIHEENGCFILIDDSFRAELKKIKTEIF
ncbi:MAG: hypothetical protein VX976_02660 [Pseudomonadota bacterium]|nr:hypothetical protein [Pseudomonadota bacterium]